MAKKIRWGVIGSGGIARRRTIPEGIVPAKNAELITVFDIATKVNAEVARQFKARAAGSIDELLSADIDAVYVATPANKHREHVLAMFPSSEARSVRETSGDDGRRGGRNDRRVPGCGRPAGHRFYDALSLSAPGSTEVLPRREDSASWCTAAPSFPAGILRWKARGGRTRLRAVAAP